MSTTSSDPLAQASVDHALFNIRNGNVCSLCEKQLAWTYSPDYETRDCQPMAPAINRAICRSCFHELIKLYPKEVEKVRAKQVV